MENINFGIDLGTTNSGIGKFQAGKVTIFKNPVGFKDTLPSVIAYRNNRILVGDKAREMTTINPDQVFSSFKRKMGSAHLYQVPDSCETKTAIDFSALILKELLGFITEEKPNAAVITIPASFDTIQSNATKLAGEAAGIHEVLLLQEPIAACLAYANVQNIAIDELKNWLVYDFGGGTFDVALVSIDNRELKVIDHEGNNFLGGLDIDHLVLEKLLCPALEKELQEENLWKQMVNGENTAYSKLFFELLYRAEEAKKELSIKEEAFVEIEIAERYIEILITRKDFNQLIHPKVDETIKLTKHLLEKNNIKNSEVDRIILVGGTTYIPYIRTCLSQVFDTHVDATIDPTTAIILGAGYYAGTKNKQTTVTKEALPATLKNVKLAYEVNSKDNEELLTGIVDQDFSGYYRVTRTDGGFDSGIIAFHSKFNEFLKLVPKTTNIFNVKILDKYHTVVYENEHIGINHGIYNISGQPLPNDICLEIDDTLGTTYLEQVFRKGDILPLNKKLYKTISKTILKASGEKLIINIVEGKSDTSPASNLCIGYLEIDSEDLPSNLLKGTDIEIDFDISESRDLTVNIYIGAITLEINQVFNASAKQVSAVKITQELEKVLVELENIYDDEFEMADVPKLEELRVEVIELLKLLIDIDGDLLTDKIYNIDERKRKAFQAYDHLIRRRNVVAEIEEYQAQKNEIREELLLKPNPKIEHAFNNITKNEIKFLNSNQSSIIRSKIRELQKIANEIYYQNDQSYIELFYYYAIKPIEDYTDENQAKKIMNNGQKAIDKENYAELKAIITSLYHLLKVKPKNFFEDQNGTLGLK